MNETTTIEAGLVRKGMTLVERDGAELLVAEVEHAGKRVQLHFARTGIVKMTPCVLLATTKVRVRVTCWRLAFNDITGKRCYSADRFDSYDDAERARQLRLAPRDYTVIGCAS